MKTKKLLSYPGKIAAFYMLFTIFLFVLGPIKWKIPSYPKLITVLLIYVGAFAAGYYFQMQRKITNVGMARLEPLCEPTAPSFGFLSGVPFKGVRLIFSASCLYSIVRGLILSSRLVRVVDLSALLRFDMATTYFDRVHAEAYGTWYILAINIVYVFELFWYVLGVLYYKKMSWPYRLLLFATAAVNIFYNLLAGATINWGIYIFRLVPIFILLVYTLKFSPKAQEVAEQQKRKKKKKALIAILIFLVLFLMLFSTMQNSRSDYLGEEQLSYYQRANLSQFIEKERPWPILNSIIYPMDFYITHGYCAMAYALELPPVFTFGIGHSRDLVNYLLNYTGIDLTGDIYPQRLEDAYNWDNGVFWPSAFTWLASDWTFWGIPIFMFLFGIFLCNVWYSALFENSIVAVILVSQLWTGIFFISANNQLFQSFQTCMGTITLLLLYAFRKRLPRIVI